MAETRAQSTESDLRYEFKLVCDPFRLSQARSWVRLHPAGFVVAHPGRRVNSLYLDTLDKTNLNENLAGLSARQKLRLRWYGDVAPSVTRPLLELKQKHNLLGKEKQYRLPCILDLTLTWTEILETVRANCGPDWLSLFQTIDHPTLITSYAREYYVTRGGAIRVTLDFDQIAYYQRLSSRPNLHARLPIADTVVIEIKTAQDHEESLEDIIAWFPVRRSRNSKYVNSLMTAPG